MAQIGRRNYIKLTLAVISSLALLTLYFYFLNSFLGPIFATPLNAVESLIFYTMILRALGIAFVPFLRKLPAQVKVLIFSLEAFVLCFLIFGLVLTRNPVYNSLLADVLTSWLGATVIVLTPYSIYELALLMYKGTNLTALFFSSTPIVAVAFFLSNLVVRIPNPSSGLSNFGAQLIDSLRSQPSLAGGNGLVTADSLSSTVSIVIFLTMIIYVVLDLNGSVPTLNDVPKYHYALALGVIGIVVVYVWLVLTAHALRENMLAILSAPAIIIPIILWVVTRE